MRGINYPASALVASLRNWFSLSRFSISPSLIRVPCLAAVPQHRHGNVLPSPSHRGYSSTCRMNPRWSEFVLIDLPSQPAAAAAAARARSLVPPRSLLARASPSLVSRAPNRTIRQPHRGVLQVFALPAGIHRVRPPPPWSGFPKGAPRRDEMRQERGREREAEREQEREGEGRERKGKEREGERYRTALSRCGIRYGTGRVIRQPGPLVRLRAAKLTRSSVYTLIATPRLRNPLRRHRVTGHRADPALRCGLFVSAEFSPRRQSSRKRSRSPSDTSRPQ